MDKHTSSDLLLERYQLLDCLQQRGETSTWKALDAHTQNPVIVKQLDVSTLQDWSIQERFEREARALEQITHPGIPERLAYEKLPEQKKILLVMSFCPEPRCDKK